MSPRSTMNRARVLAILVLMLTCLCALAGVWLVEQIPQNARRDFGSPAPGLGSVERIRYSLQLEWGRADLLQPLKAGATAQQEFVINSGEAVPSIARRLEQEGLIRNADIFRIYLIYSGLDTRLQAGKYKLSPALPAIQIASALLDATPGEVSLRVFAGWRLEEVAEALPVSGLNLSPEDFLLAARSKNGYRLPAGWPELPSVEGFLYPDVYTVSRTINAADLISLMLNRFDQKVTPEMRQALTRQKLDLRQAVTLASLVQREGMVEEERPMIASVFLNRLNIKMKLDCDPTVQYAVGYNAKQRTWWTNPLSANDLKIDSPYNTYRYPNLPPGPIASPGLSALNAVAYPAQTPYLYFRAQCDQSGRHFFARTYEEHVKNACP